MCPHARRCDVIVGRLRRTRAGRPVVVPGRCSGPCAAPQAPGASTVLLVHWRRERPGLGPQAVPTDWVNLCAMPPHARGLYA